MIENTLEKELNLSNWQVKKVINLIDEGNTIPFIARYRKDVTGSLNDETLRKFDERLKYLRNLEEKKQKVLKRIEELGKLDGDLKNRIINVSTLVELEDLYRPFKSKKQTRATKAKEKGLEPLALEPLYLRAPQAERERKAGRDHTKPLRRQREEEGKAL